MNRTDLERIWDARLYVLAALEAARDGGFDAVWSSRVRGNSLILDVILIGEALAKVSPAVKVVASEIPWTEIAWTRNRLIHVYWLHERQFIEDLLERDLPPLLASLTKLRSLLEEPS